MSRVDLHLHSNASDGKLSPEELIREAVAAGLEVIALTDHDTVDGIIPARDTAGEFPDLTFVPGVEISTDLPDGEAHILGYFIDYTSPELEASLVRFRDSRTIRARRMVAKLAEMGIDIDWSRVQEIAGEGSIGRPHIARAMLEKKYITSFEEAFDKYIGHGGPAYVEREKMTPTEAVRLVKEAGGIAVLAHPFTVGDNNTVISMVQELKPHGLDGVEAYYKDNTPEQTEAMLAMADEHGLIATGGTDYHGDEAGGERLGGVEVPLEAAEKLLALAGWEIKTHPAE